MNLDINENEDGKTPNIKINSPNAIGNAEFLKGTTLSPYSGNSLQLSSQSHLIPNFSRQQQSQPHDSYHFMLSNHLTANENFCDGNEVVNDCDNINLAEDVLSDETTGKFRILEKYISYLI